MSHDKPFQKRCARASQLPSHQGNYGLDQLRGHRVCVCVDIPVCDVKSMYILKWLVMACDNKHHNWG